jgi:hypothetical protein
VQPGPLRRAGSAAAALLLTLGGLLALQVQPPRVPQEPDPIWLQWPSSMQTRPPPEPAPAVAARAVRPAPRLGPKPLPRPVVPAAPQAITLPAPAAESSPAPPVSAIAAAASPPASAASAPPLRLRLDGPAGRAAAVASRSDVQTMAQRADTPLVHGHVSEQERLANRIAETAMPSCTDPVPGGLLGIPLLILRPLAGRCK